MPAAFVVGKCVSSIVAATTHRAADEADPEVGIGVADGALVKAAVAALMSRTAVGALM